jgi:flavin-dependent dehydrogenase
MRVFILESMMRIGIIGAGPAGLFLAEKLARNGRQVVLFDHRAPWEKPCGGGLSARVFREFPEIYELTDEWHRVDGMKIILYSGEPIELSMTTPLVTISRRVLSGAMLNKALEAGVCHIPEKVEDIIPGPKGFSIITGNREEFCQFLAGADGAGGITRKKLSRKFNKENFFLAFTSLVHSKYRNPLTIRLYSDMAGYAWIFPRKDHTSIGIGAKPGRQTAKEMKQRLKRFLDQEFIKAGLDTPGSIPLKPALIPCLSMESIEEDRAAGQGWALVGDSSGIVDPITGEGIYYAFKTAEILFQSLMQDQGESYQSRLRQFTAASLHRAPLWFDTYYKSSIQKICAWFYKSSPLARKILRELIQGEQDYLTLKQRVIREAPKACLQALLASLRR